MNSPSFRHTASALCRNFPLPLSCLRRFRCQWSIETFVCNVMLFFASKQFWSNKEVPIISYMMLNEYLFLDEEGKPYRKLLNDVSLKSVTKDSHLTENCDAAMAAASDFLSSCQQKPGGATPQLPRSPARFRTDLTWPNFPFFSYIIRRSSS